jgi:two-component system CAI-1 autoinducer sensor kinase/phosphatase CqsS
MNVVSNLHEERGFILKITQRLDTVLDHAETNLTYIGLLGSLGFPLYFFIWEYIFPQPYENMWLRIICSVSYLPWLIYKNFFYKYKRFFSCYFIFSLFLSLPYFFSFMFIKNDFSSIWAMSLIASTSLLIIVVYDWILVNTMIIGGFILSLFSMSTPVNIANFQIEFVPIFLFILISCSLATHRHKIDRQLKIKYTKSLAGSIAHEMRNPLSQIHSSLHLISRQGTAIDQQLMEYLQDANKIAKSGLQVIDITMDAIHEKPIRKDNFSVICAKDIISNTLKDYAYTDSEHAEKLSCIGGDFELSADPVVLKYILYNLIGNALYFVKTLPDADIVISINAANRQIQVRDTGPGIDESSIPKLFDSFYTSNKQGGTGLGLSYCKRSMGELGGTIDCTSKLGEYTTFTLTFPDIPKKKASIKHVA